MSGTETLASMCAAGCDDPAAALRCHAGAKTVAAFAHQLARLIGPFHRSFSAGANGNGRRQRAAPGPFRHSPELHGTAARIPRLIREAALARQLRAGGHRGDNGGTHSPASCPATQSSLRIVGRIRRFRRNPPWSSEADYASLIRPTSYELRCARDTKGSSQEGEAAVSRPRVG